MGSGGPSIENVILAADKTSKGPKRMGPFVVPELCQYGFSNFGSPF